MSTEQIRERVERGVALLDEHVPDWWQRLDTDILDIGDGSVCVLGQVYATEGDCCGWCNGTAELQDAVPGFRTETAWQWGFDIGPDGRKNAVEDIWREIARERRIFADHE